MNIIFPLASHTVQTRHTATHTTYVIDSESQIAIGKRIISKVTSAHFLFASHTVVSKARPKLHLL